MEIKPHERRLIVTQGDITLLPLHDGAIVNPSNTGLILSSGVSASIARRGGPFLQQILHMRRSTLRNNRLDPGKAIDTDPGQLPVKRLIHVAIVGAKKVNKRLISHSIINAYDLAEKLKLTQIAFPAIGCGIGGFPLEGFLDLFWRITSEELPRAKHLRQVYLCMFEGEEFDAVKAYTEAHLQELPKSILVEISETGLAPGMFR